MEGVGAIPPELTTPAPSGTSAGRSQIADKASPERRQLTVLFCDLVGSTQLATRLDPEDLREVILDYLKACTQVIENFGGYVANYQGDGMLAYFGYPQAQEDAAERAARAGLRLIAEVPRRQIRDDAALQVRVGISTGLTVAGDRLGEGGAREEAVIGEAPILAARLQQLAGPGTVLIAESTKKLLGRIFELKDLGLHDLKGFADPARIWSLVSTRDLDSRFEGTRGQGAEQGIGRDQELGLLVDRWDSALAAEGQIVGLFGEAGIGKSRMCAMLQEHIGAAPHAFLRLQCSPLHTSSALYPVIAYLERVIGLTPDLSTEIKLARLGNYLTERELVGSLPLFAALLFRSFDERHPSSTMSPEELKQRTLDALADWLLSFAGSQPVLAIIEDAHWIDPSTEDFVRRCIERIASARLLLIVTYRPDFRRNWLDSGNLTALGLNRLHRHQARDMVRSVAGSTVLPPELIDYIVTRTDGVPLFIQEVTKNVLESDLLRVQGDPRAIPTTLQDSLLARLDRLGSVKEIAQIGAAVGREFSHKLLEVITSGYSGTLEVAIGRLVRADLIRVRGRPPEATYVFKHALLQDAAYSTLVRSKRRELHLRIADALQEHFPQQAEAEPELVAHHLTEAEVGTQATEWWERAGKLAVQRSANFEAVNHFNKALGVLARDPESAVRDERELELRTSLHSPLYVTTGYASSEMEANYAQVERLCERLGATARLLRVLWGQGTMTLVRSEFGPTLARMERFMVLAERARDANAIVAGRRVIDYVHLARGDLRTCRAGLEQALKAYDSQLERSFAATYNSGLGLPSGAACILSFAVQQLGYLDQSARLADQALTEAKQSGHAPSLAYVLFSRAWFWIVGNDPPRVRQATEELLTVIKTNDIRYYNSYYDIFVGWTTAKAGDLEEGLRRMRRGAAARKAARASLWMPFHLTREAELLNEHERFDEALELLRTTQASIEETEQRYAAAELYRLRALALIGKHATPAEIEKDFQQALDIARQQEAKLWELRAAVSYAEYLRDDGRVGEARALLAPVYAWFTEGLDTGDLKTAKRLLETLTQTH
jgi:class 3 adenylate cyclase/predicted ATPase